MHVGIIIRAVLSPLPFVEKSSPTPFMASRRGCMSEEIYVIYTHTHIYIYIIYIYNFANPNCRWIVFDLAMHIRICSSFHIAVSKIYLNNIIIIKMVKAIYET